MRRLPAAAWVCAAVACMNAAAWSIITPPFQSPDEPQHVAYVRSLVKLHHLPSSEGNFSTEELIAFEDLGQQSVALSPENHTISTRAQQLKLQRDLKAAEKSPHNGTGYAGQATSEPPLYYLLQAIPYSIAGSGTLLDRIELMRLLSALMAGLTALFAFLFLREALPGARRAWTVGGLSVALVPLLGFMSGVVNPDSMLYAVTAAVFFALARGFRHGLSRKLAVALGAAIAIGFATKLNFVGIAPGALLGLIVLSIRAARTLGRAAYVSLGLALAVALSPAAVSAAIHLASGTPPLGFVSGVIENPPRSFGHQLIYIWQLYLPRLPTMHNDFVGLSSSALWFHSYVGQYGWLDTTFPNWVNELALISTILLFAFFLRGLLACRGTLRGRAVELSVYLLMGAGLMALVGVGSYASFPEINAEYIQARYLLPLLPLLGAALALAARGAGRRWAPILGAGIVMLFLAHDIFSQLQTVARFYG